MLPLEHLAWNKIVKFLIYKFIPSFVWSWNRHLRLNSFLKSPSSIRIFLQILIHIEEKLGSSVIECFDWLAGTSTGAIIALALARGIPSKKKINFKVIYSKSKGNFFLGFFGLF